MRLQTSPPADRAVRRRRLHVRRRTRVAILSGTLFALTLNLGSQPPSLTEGNIPQMISSPPTDPLTVRVGILEDYERLTFQMHGSFSVESLAGEKIREAKPSGVKWRARAERSDPAQFLFSLLVSSFRDRDRALALAESFEAQGTPALVRQIGGPIEVGDHIIGDSTLYRVQVGSFKTEADAKPLIDSLEDEYAPRIVREVLRDAHGAIELFDADLIESFTVKDGFRLIPAEPDAHVTVFGVRTGSGFRYEKTENRDYSGVLEVYLDHLGHLAAINIIPIDDYLRGVVPAEMPAGFPHEALKAQAILARTVVLAEKTTKHLNDRFELCAHVHCQVYGGIGKEDPRTSAAVDETRGMVLVNHGTLAEAYYSAVCGGHTESATDAWLKPSMHAVAGRPCTCSDSVVIPDLTTEAGARQWISSSPDVCCNLTHTNLPVSSDYARRHFRWEVSYSRPELEAIIREKTGVDIGTLYDIVPVRRGRSGRLVEIEILGSRRNLRIQRELRIRRALSATALESSCFVVDVVQDEFGDPKEFVFSGAGWGHGVGMCQCGAARQAAEGKSFGEILQFYFPGTEIETLY
jgi:stage II sporulation protein D